MKHIQSAIQPGIQSGTPLLCCNRTACQRFMRTDNETVGMNTQVFVAAGDDHDVADRHRTLSDSHVLFHNATDLSSSTLAVSSADAQMQPVAFVRQPGFMLSRLCVEKVTYMDYLPTLSRPVHELRRFYICRT